VKASVVLPVLVTLGACGSLGCTDIAIAYLAELSKAQSCNPAATEPCTAYRGITFMLNNTTYAYRVVYLLASTPTPSRPWRPWLPSTLPQGARARVASCFQIRGVQLFTCRPNASGQKSACSLSPVRKRLTVGLNAFLLKRLGGTGSPYWYPS